MTDGWADAAWDISIADLRWEIEQRDRRRDNAVRVWHEYDRMCYTESGQPIPDGWTAADIEALFKYWESL